MPLLSFQAWKAAEVEAGRSRQTIRWKRKYPIEVGDRRCAGQSRQQTDSGSDVRS